jgi:hypothetical protein
VLSLLFALAPSVEAAFPGPNGRIAFNGLGGITTVRPDGTGRRVLLEDGSAYNPSYSPDGRRIAFVTSLEGNETATGVVRADGRNRRRLTTGPFDSGPEWSPDGRRLVFFRQHPCEDYSEGGCPRRLRSSRDYGILVYDRGRTRVLTRAGWGGIWSPDGGLIAFLVFQGELWLMRPDGSRQRDIYRLPGNFPLFDWSPDGRKILIGAPAARLIAVIDRHGHRRSHRRLIRDAEDAAYSPDGRQIVFTRFEQSLECSVKLWVARADGTHQRMLRYPSGRPICGSNPDWGPRR